MQSVVVAVQNFYWRWPQNNQVDYTYDNLCSWAVRITITVASGTSFSLYYLALITADWPCARYLLRTPPRIDALRHSGEERRRWTSATVTLYLEVELSSDSRPGTEQKTSPGASPLRVVIDDVSLDVVTATDVFRCWLAVSFQYVPFNYFICACMHACVGLHVYV